MPKSSARVLDVLELLATQQKPQRHSEISQRMGIPKSSLTGLLNDLHDRGYIAFDSETRRYALGAEVLRISKGYLEKLSIIRIGRPALSEIIRQIDESPALAIRDGHESVVVAQESCSHPLAHTMVIGSRSSLHCTASGKALLAFLPEKEREELLGELKLPRVTRRTITNKREFRESLDQVSKTGFAVSDEEAIDGVFALAFPVVGNQGVVAALSAAVPISRLNEARKRDLVTVLRAGAERISDALGGDLRSVLKQPR